MGKIRAVSFGTTGITFKVTLPVKNRIDFSEIKFTSRKKEEQ